MVGPGPRPIKAHFVHMTPLRTVGDVSPNQFLPPPLNSILGPPLRILMGWMCHELFLYQLFCYILQLLHSPVQLWLSQHTNQFSWTTWPLLFYQLICWTENLHRLFLPSKPALITKNSKNDYLTRLVHCKMFVRTWCNILFNWKQSQWGIKNSEKAGPLKLLCSQS